MHKSLPAIALAFLCCEAVLAQSAPTVSISPAAVTMLVGESRPFRAVDGTGKFLHEVEWSLSESGIVEMSSGDEALVTARQTGRVTLTAHTRTGTGYARIQVAAGSQLPQGTVLWSSGDVPGCHTTRIMPAVPVPNGPDVFEQSQCPDGTYIRAYTAEGILLWRRKIDSSPKAAAKPEVPPVALNSLNTRAGSICDSISIGMKQEAVGELLKARNLAAFAGREKIWIVEEEGTQCKLWFDATTSVSKKRKTLVAD